MSGELRYPANSLIRSENFLQSNALTNVATDAFFPAPILITINLTGSGYLSSPVLEKYTPLLPNELSGTGSLNNPALDIVNIFSGDFDGIGNITGNLAQTKNIVIDLTGSSNLNGALINVLNLSHDLSGTSDLVGNFELSKTLNPNPLNGTGSLNGILSSIIDLAGELSGTGSLDSSGLIQSIYLNSNPLNGVSDLNGLLLGIVEFSKDISGSSNLVGNLSQIHNLIGSNDGLGDIFGSLSISGNQKLFSGNLTGSGDLNGNLRIFEFAGKFDGIKREKDIDLAISQNGNLVSGSIFSVATLPNNTDGSRLVFVPFLNKSRSRAVKPPSSNFSVEIYIDNYFDSKLWAKVDFSSTTEIGQIIPMSNWKNLESGERLIFVSNQTFILESFFNDITFGINLAFGVCK